MNKILIALSFAGIIVSCSDNKKESSAIGSAQITMLVSPSADSSAEPYLFTDKNGAVYLSWVEKKNKGSKLKFSSYSNDKWSEPSIIAAGNNWFVNWADYPVISADGASSLLAHFLEKSDTAKFTYDIKLVSSSDIMISFLRHGWMEEKLQVSKVIVVMMVIMEK